MKKNNLITHILASLLLYLLIVPQALASDYRALQLRSYLEKVGSPMVGYETIMIKVAENHGLDWTLLAAIAGTESTFGKRMPHQCINPYGWGVYGQNKLCFTSFEDAIHKVGEGIGTKYNTSSLESIARKYNTVSTENWTSSTRFFMNKIKSQEISAKNLPIKL